MPNHSTGGCKTYPPATFGLVEETRRTQIGADSNFSYYTAGWNELTSWEQSAGNPNQILEAGIIRGLVEQIGLNAPDVINSLINGQVVTINTENGPLKISQEIELIVIMQEPQTIGSGLGSTGLNFGHTYCSSAIVVRHGRFENSVRLGRHSDRIEELDIMNPFILIVGRDTPAFFRLASLFWGVDTGEYKNESFYAREYDPNFGLYR